MRRSKAGVFAAALSGFLVGAAFGHAVGIRDFVDDLVFDGPAAEVRSVPQAGVACSAVVLDRESHRAYEASCPLDAPELAESVGHGKADFAGVQRFAARPRWSMNVLTEPEPVDGDTAD